MSGSGVSIATDRAHHTYQSVWDEYAAGRMSTSVMRQLLDNDEVFRRWCIKRAEADRHLRDIAAQEDDSA